MESEEQGVEKLMIYNEVHRLRSEGFSNSSIARKLKISRNRVIEYGKMSPDEFYLFAISLQKRSKKLDPFRTIDLIRMHENAFRFYGGMSIEIVYDQDRLLAVSENAGDLIMTEEFTKYQQTRNFKIYLCRKSDPQTKGKIEQVVKYVKNNFAKNRTFDNLIDWQDSCMKWLKRTGNYKIHHNTKKRPVEVYALEKQHLQQVSGTYIFEDIFDSSITRTINKDNVIRYDGNRYSVPRGTYRKSAPNIAYVNPDGEYLCIRLQKNGQILAKHTIAEGSGAVISDPSHRKRNQTKRNLLIQQIEGMLDDNEATEWLVGMLTKQYPRHLIDQLKVVQSVILKYPFFVMEAINELKRLRLTSANDLRDIAISLEIDSRKERKDTGSVNEKYKNLVAPERKEDIYLSVLQGGGNR
ncbi:IS21 family transposase [Bacillaceae bacterium IKA-2]|nr:IS21 family transposase [Bacillaceae bacterium IKA-2]